MQIKKIDKTSYYQLYLPEERENIKRQCHRKCSTWIRVLYKMIITSFHLKPELIELVKIYCQTSGIKESFSAFDNEISF